MNSEFIDSISIEREIRFGLFILLQMTMKKKCVGVSIRRLSALLETDRQTVIP